MELPTRARRKKKIPAARITMTAANPASETKVPPLLPDPRVALACSAATSVVSSFEPAFDPPVVVVVV
ncbi:MAG: hypothetical protein ACXW2C_10195, partial [Acidimicrobiia bacterium]